MSEKPVYPHTTPAARYALAKLAWNATAQYIKLRGATWQAWDQCEDRRQRDLIDEILRVEAALTGRDDVDVSILSKREFNVPDPFLGDDGPYRIFHGVALAGIKLEINWKEPRPPGPKSVRDMVVEGIEAAAARAVSEFMVPHRARLSPANYDAFTKAPHFGGERIVLAGSPQAADGPTLVKVWTAKGNIVIIEDPDLDGDIVLVDTVKKARGQRTRRVTYMAALT